MPMSGPVARQLRDGAVGRGHSCPRPSPRKIRKPNAANTRTIPTLAISRSVKWCLKNMMSTLTTTAIRAKTYSTTPTCLAMASSYTMGRGGSSGKGGAPALGGVDAANDRCGDPAGVGVGGARAARRLLTLETMVRDWRDSRGQHPRRGEDPPDAGAPLKLQPACCSATVQPGAVPGAWLLLAAWVVFHEPGQPGGGVKLPFPAANAGPAKLRTPAAAVPATAARIRLRRRGVLGRSLACRMVPSFIGNKTGSSPRPPICQIRPMRLANLLNWLSRARGALPVLLSVRF